MTWFTDPNCEAAAGREHILIAYAASLVFPGGTVRLTTYTDAVTIDGNSYTPAYNADGQLLVGISDLKEMVQLYAERWTYTLAGVDPSILPDSEIDNSYGGAVNEYEVYIDPDTRALIGYELRREGKISNVRRVDSSTPTIEVNCEHRLVILEKSSGHRYTKQHQEARFFAGDLGCDNVAKLESKEVLWGGRRVNAGGFAGSILDSVRNLRNRG